MARIKICFFCSLGSFDTGMPISTFKLIQHFSAHPDFQVFVILPSKGELAKRIRQCGIEPRIVAFYRFRSPHRFLSFIRFMATVPLAFVRVVYYLRVNDMEIIHFSDLIDAPFYLCGRLAAVKTVAHLRYCLENAAARLLFRLVTDVFIDNVVCISNAVLRYAGLKRPRAAVIYNPGPDPALFDPLKKTAAALPLPDNGAIVLTIGKFVRAKGHEHFVRMAQTIETRHPGLCRYVILGEAVPARREYFTKIQRLITSFSLNEKIILIDNLPHERVADLLARTAVFAHLPNYQEGLGGVLLEALAMEVPVVAFDCGGIGECFTNAVSGFLVTQYDVEAAADRVVQLLIDGDLRKRMGAEGRKEVLSRFSYQKHFSEIETIYRSFFKNR